MDLGPSVKGWFERMGFADAPPKNKKTACGRKVQYSERGAALVIAAALRHGKNLYAYKCPTCPFTHTTSIPQKETQ